MLQLGQKAKDKITQLEGILIGRAQYITGCDQYAIQTPAVNAEVKPAQWFDEGRIEILGEGITIKEVTAEAPGGPQVNAPVYY
jgi:hypothetical protein